MKTYLKWGFDIDGVIADFTTCALKVCKKLYNLNFGYNEVKSFHWETLLTREMLDKLVGVTLANQPYIFPVYGAIPFIRKYYKETKHIPIFITSRPSTIAKETANWLGTYLSCHNVSSKKITYGDNYEVDAVPFEIIFSNYKSCFIADRKIDVFVEDRVKHATEISEDCNTKVLLFNHPWNQHMKESNSVVRLNSWGEIDRVYESLKKTHLSK